MNKNKFERGNVMRKKDRHRLIIRLLNEFAIEKQEDFVEILKKHGVEVTQATISRDIKELKLVKIPAADGNYRYSLPQESNEDLFNKLLRLLKTACIAIDSMDKMIMIKTIPGNASAVGNLLDKCFKEELFGLLNDDDSILMILRTEQDCATIYQKLRNF